MSITSITINEKKVVEYKMIAACTENTLSTRVNNWIEQNFQPYGEPFTSYNPDTKVQLFCQSMVKYRE